jgi:pyrroline-5-carboxylate reductase
MKFGFIGAGNMAAAIIKGMTIGTKSYKGEDISVTEKAERVILFLTAYII